MKEMYSKNLLFRWCVRGKLIINLGENIGPFYFGMTNIEYDKIHEAYLEKFKQFYGISVILMRMTNWT